MATVTFNIGKGRVIEMYRNLKANIRPNAAFMIVLLQAVESDATIVDKLTLDAVLTDVSNTEGNFTNYVRQQIVGGDLAILPVPDLGNDKFDVTFPDVTIASAGGALNNSLVKCVLCHVDDTTAIVDTDVVPLVAFDYVTTTDGTGLLIQFPTDAFSAS